MLLLYLLIINSLKFVYLSILFMNVLISEHRLIFKKLNNKIKIISNNGNSKFSCSNDFNNILFFVIL